MLSYDFVNAINLLPGIIKAINTEMTACVYYMNLVELAPGNVEKELIDKIIEDDILSCNIYRDVYEKITGNPPLMTTPRSPDIDSFEVGISKSFLTETKSLGFYKGLYLGVNNELLKSAFYNSMSEKEGHILKLLYMGAYSGANE